MNTETKAKLFVAAAGLAFAGVFTLGVNHNLRKKRREAEPLPGTTKIAKLYVITENKK